MNLSKCLSSVKWSCIVNGNRGQCRIEARKLLKRTSESFLCSLLSEEIISLLLFWHAFIVDRVLWRQSTLYGGLCSLWFMARLRSPLSLRPARSRPCCTPPPASCRSPRPRSPRPRTWTWSLGIIF